MKKRLRELAIKKLEKIIKKKVGKEAEEELGDVIVLLGGERPPTGGNG
jgi:F0F1-type ATP synthase membrane subunit b/b'